MKFSSPQAPAQQLNWAKILSEQPTDNAVRWDLQHKGKVIRIHIVGDTAFVYAKDTKLERDNTFHWGDSYWGRFHAKRFLLRQNGQRKCVLELSGLLNSAGEIDRQAANDNLEEIARALAADEPVEEAEEAEAEVSEWLGQDLPPEDEPIADPPMLAAALDYAVRRGWEIFPADISLDKKTGKFRKKSFKSAKHSGGAKWGKTRDPEQIRRDFTRWPKAGIGIPTGKDNGIWVVEVDTPKGHDVDGIASLRALEEKHGPLPKTLMAESPSGSLHYYFKWPDGWVEIRNSTSAIAPGIDVRGEGGMVIAPPSVRGDGKYRCLDGDPAEAPQWLIDAAVAAASKGKGKGEGESEGVGVEGPMDPAFADLVPSREPAPIEQIRAAFAVIPNDDLDWEEWNKRGMALYRATAGSDDGLAIFHAWSSKSKKKYDEQGTNAKWAAYKTCPPTEISVGSIFYWANKASPDWERSGGPTEEKPGKDDGARGLLWEFIGTALRNGVDENKIVRACLDEKYCGGVIYEHVRDSGGEEYVKQQIERVLNYDPLIARRKRSVIRIEGGKLHELWRAVQRELISRGCPVYVRGNRLVQPLWRWEKTPDGREFLAAQFERYNAPRLADMVAHYAVQFQKFDGRKRAYKNIDPPEDTLIKHILEAKQWNFPTVVGIINTLTMRADGSLLTTEGYDPATQLWFKSSGDVTLPPIPDKPSKEEARRALVLLKELLEEFPFDNEIARAAALAGVMTPVLRGALAGAVPLFAVIATEPRSGKTYLVHLIAVIATGHIPVPTAGAEKSEEMEKRIETAGLSGRPIIHLNNLPNGMVVESVALAQLSTEGMISIRKLGRHEEGLCDCRATTVFLNGNNIIIAEDLIPRTVLSRLNPQLEQPENRTFKGDPIKCVRADRGKYLGAIFTIARAFMAAGYPEVPHKVVVGFEGWSRLVQQPLIWLGEQDPLGGMDELKTLDPRQGELHALLEALKKHFNADESFTVADCKRKAEELVDRDLRDVMTDARGQINNKSFGWKLARHRDRIHDGWYIEVVADSTKREASVYKLKNKPGAARILQAVEEEDIKAALGSSSTTRSAATVCCTQISYGRRRARWSR